LLALFFYFPNVFEIFKVILFPFIEIWAHMLVYDS